MVPKGSDGGLPTMAMLVVDGNVYVESVRDNRYPDGGQLTLRCLDQPDFYPPAVW